MSSPISDTPVNGALRNLAVQVANPQSYLSLIPRDIVKYYLGSMCLESDNVISELSKLMLGNSDNNVANSLRIGIVSNEIKKTQEKISNLSNNIILTDTFDTIIMILNYNDYKNKLIKEFGEEFFVKYRISV